MLEFQSNMRASMKSATTGFAFSKKDETSRPALISLVEPVNHGEPLTPFVEGSTGWKCWKAIDAVVSLSRREFMQSFMRIVVRYGDYDSMLVDAAKEVGEIVPDGCRRYWLIRSNEAIILGMRWQPFVRVGLDMIIPHPRIRRFYEDERNREAFARVLADAYVEARRPVSFLEL